MSVTKGMKSGDHRSAFVTDDELRARYGDAAELLIDALDRKVETQKFAIFSRDREAVEAALAARLNHEQR